MKPSEWFRAKGLLSDAIVAETADMLAEFGGPEARMAYLVDNAMMDVDPFIDMEDPDAD